MAIQWTGLFANTGYSSANNKTQDDAVTGMQDTLYVTGPGYGAYEAVVKLYNSTGALVATVNVSGGGGAFSAPPPVRFVDNGTVYSYSLEVVRGFIPTEDADGIVIRLVGGASKRYPSMAASTPSGDVAVAGAITASAVRAPKNLPGIGALSPLGNGGSAVGIAATYISQYPAIAPYMMVRPRFKNFTASPWTINSFKFASTPTDENDGTTLTWVAGTIAGAAGGDVPAAVGSGVSVQPGILYGDAVPLASLVRTDVVGALPLLQMRVYAVAGSPQQANAGTAALNASTGLMFKGTNASGDRVGTIDARIPVDGTLTYYVCDIEFFYTERVVSLLDAGDSRSHGSYSDSGEYGPSTGAMVFSLDRNGALVSGANYGIDGAPTTAIHAQLLKMLPIVKPAYATVWMESPNDGNAIGPYNTAFARAVDVVQACIDAGTIPIIYTPTPRNRVTTDLVAWQTAVARIRAYANAGGLLLVDNALEAEDPAIPGAWKAQYKPAGDTSNNHGNQAFYEWQGRELLKRIRGL